MSSVGTDSNSTVSMAEIAKESATLCIASMSDAVSIIDATSLASEGNVTDKVDAINEVSAMDKVNATNGVNGTDGINGVNAANGVNGTDGINGVNAANGVNGTDGINGVNAANGVFVTEGVNAASRGEGVSTTLLSLSLQGAKLFDTTKSSSTPSGTITNAKSIDPPSDTMNIKFTAPSETLDTKYTATSSEPLEMTRIKSPCTLSGVSNIHPEALEISSHMQIDVSTLFSNITHMQSCDLPTSATCSPPSDMKESMNTRTSLPSATKSLDSHIKTIWEEESTLDPHISLCNEINKLFDCSSFDDETTLSEPNIQESTTLHPPTSETSNPSFFQIHKSQLERLSTEAMMLKEFLPTVLNSYYISCVCQVPMLEERMNEVRKERRELVLECKKLRREKDILMSDCEQERKEKFAAKVCSS